MKKPPVKSIRHKAQKRVHIPSGEEAGYEAASPLVQSKDKSEFPKNPIVHRGQDPELYWLNKYSSAEALAKAGGEDNGDTPSRSIFARFIGTNTSHPRRSSKAFIA